MLNTSLIEDNSRTIPPNFVFHKLSQNRYNQIFHMVPCQTGSLAKTAELVGLGDGGRILDKILGEDHLRTILLNFGLFGSEVSKKK